MTNDQTTDPDALTEINPEYALLTQPEESMSLILSIKKEQSESVLANSNKSQRPQATSGFDTQPSSDNKRIFINVGGIRYETYKSTLKLIKESRLANLSSTNSDYDPVRNEYFFDRDPVSFLAILNYFRTGLLHAPNLVCGNRFYDELRYFKSISSITFLKYQLRS